MIQVVNKKNKLNLSALTHLEGFEPPLVEPESTALSPELQVH